MSEFHRTFDGLLPPAPSKPVCFSGACSMSRLPERSDRPLLAVSSPLPWFWSVVLKSSSLGVVSYFQTWTQISLKSTVLKITVDGCIPAAASITSPVKADTEGFIDGMRSLFIACAQASSGSPLRICILGLNGKHTYPPLGLFGRITKAFSVLRS